MLILGRIAVLFEGYGWDLFWGGCITAAWLLRP